jgi:hypothetical protein
LNADYPEAQKPPDEIKTVGWLRSIRWRAVAAGVTADIVTSMVLWSLYAGAFLAEKIARYGGIEQIPEQSLSQQELLTLGFIGTVGTVVGGYVAGRIAVEQETRHGVAAAVASLVLGLGLELASQGVVRLAWWKIPFLILTIPAGAFGGYLARWTHNWHSA